MNFRVSGFRIGEDFSTVAAGIPQINTAGIRWSSSIKLHRGKFCLD